MRGWIQFVIGIGVLALLLGCAMSGGRAQQRPAAFHHLSPGEQSLVLHGQLRVGMSKDAVYIAWGEPDRKIVGGKEKEDQEVWLYERRLTVTEPFGASDQYGPYHDPGNSLRSSGPPVGFGYRGYSDVGMLSFQPHIRVIEVRYQRAEFTGGKLVHYLDRRDGSTRSDRTPER